MKGFFAGLGHYLKDWRNLLGHALLGVGILAVSALMPVPPWARVLLFVTLVALNLLRERRKHRRVVGAEESAGDEA